MLSKEDLAVMKALSKRGVYLKDIAVEVGVHPKTVSRALQRGGAAPRLRKRRGSKLDPYRAKVDQLCESLGGLFIDFLELLKRGESVRIIDRMDALGLSAFS